MVLKASGAEAPRSSGKSDRGLSSPLVADVAKLMASRAEARFQKDTRAMTEGEGGRLVCLSPLSVSTKKRATYWPALTAPLSRPLLEFSSD